MFFDGFQDLIRIAVVGTAAYISLVAILRLTGKRTLSKLNAFDLIVTVAFGSTLATVLLNRDVTLAEGVVAFALLASLQLVVTFTSVRSERFQRLVKATPALLVYRGKFLDAALVDERVTREEIYAATRASGLTDLADVLAVVLETDSSFSVICNNGGKRTSALRNVSGFVPQTRA